MRLVLILLLGFLIAAPSAHALTITGGSAGGIQPPLIACLEPGVNVSGADFTLSGFSGTTFCPGLSVTMQFVGSLTLNGMPHPGTCVPACVDNTTFFFAAAPFSEPTPLDLPHYHGPYSTTFTMTGHTMLAGGVDFDGVGFMTLGLILGDTQTSVFQRFDFAPAPVPESPWLALIAFAGTVGAAAVKTKRTRARVTAA